MHKYWGWGQQSNLALVNCNKFTIKQIKIFKFYIIKIGQMELTIKSVKIKGEWDWMMKILKFEQYQNSEIPSRVTIVT